MATISRFEELEAWLEARRLTNKIYALSRQDDFAKDFALGDQIRKAGISVMSNIAEGFERGGTSEFIQFLSYARGSAGEIKSQLYVALDATYITQEQFDEGYEIASRTIRLVSGLMRYLKKTRLSGTKYKPQ